MTVTREMEVTGHDGHVTSFTVEAPEDLEPGVYEADGAGTATISWVHDGQKITHTFRVAAVEVKSIDEDE